MKKGERLKVGDNVIVLKKRKKFDVSGDVKSFLWDVKRKNETFLPRAGDKFDFRIGELTFIFTHEQIKALTNDLIETLENYEGELKSVYYED
jgi:hypothetical protein